MFSRSHCRPARGAQRGGRIAREASGQDAARTIDAAGRSGARLQGMGARGEIPWTQGEATCVAFSPDGKLIAVGGGSSVGQSPDFPHPIESGTLRIWNPVTGEVMLEPAEPEDRINAVCFYPDGGRLVFGDRRKTTVLDARTGARRFTVPQGGSSLTFNSAGNVFTTMPNTMWDANTGSMIEAYWIHNGQSAVFSPDGLLCCVDGSLYDLKAQTKWGEVTQRRTKGGWSRWAFSHDSKWLTSGFGMWSTTDSTPVWHRSDRSSEYVTGVLFSPDDRTLIVSDGNGTIDVFDSRSDTLLTQISAGARSTASRSRETDSPSFPSGEVPALRLTCGRREPKARELDLIHRLIAWPRSSLGCSDGPAALAGAPRRKPTLAVRLHRRTARGNSVEITILRR